MPAPVRKFNQHAFSHREKSRDMSPRQRVLTGIAGLHVNSAIVQYEKYVLTGRTGPADPHDFEERLHCELPDEIGAEQDPEDRLPARQAVGFDAGQYTDREPDQPDIYGPCALFRTSPCR